MTQWYTLISHNIKPLKAGQKMGKRKYLSDKGSEHFQNSKSCGLYAVVSTYQKWCKEGQPANRWQGHGHPRLTDARGELRLPRLVRLHRRAIVAQITENLIT